MITAKINSKGFTILEALLSVIIMILLIASILPNFSSFKNSQALLNASEDVLSVVSKARSQTLASVDSSEYGVHFESGKAVIFKGTLYSPSASTNEIINIISPASISVINFAGGGNEIYFDRLSGAPNKTGTVTISVSGYTPTKTITLLASGGISAN